MKKYFPYFLVFVFITVFILIFTSGDETVTFNTVTVPGKFSISIPGYLTRTDSLDSRSLLQYKNEREQILVVIYEDNDSLRSLKESFKKFSDDFISGISRGNLEAYYPEKIHGTDALVGTVRGSVNETKVFYRIAVVQGKKNFYRLIAGTTEKNHGDYEEDLDQIIRSFTLLAKK